MSFLQQAASKKQDQTSACFERQPMALHVLLLQLPIHPAGSEVRPNNTLHRVSGQVRANSTHLPHHQHPTN